MYCQYLIKVEEQGRKVLSKLLLMRPEKSGPNSKV